MGVEMEVGVGVGASGGLVGCVGVGVMRGGMGVDVGSGGRGVAVGVGSSKHPAMAAPTMSSAMTVLNVRLTRWLSPCERRRLVA